MLLRGYKTRYPRPIVAAQHKEEREKRGWYHLTLKSQRVILSESADVGLTILSVPLSYIYWFLNLHNVTAIQSDCALTYIEDNIYLLT